MTECPAKVFKIRFRARTTRDSCRLSHAILFFLSLSFLCMNTARACVESIAQREKARRYTSDDVEVKLLMKSDEK